MDDSQLLERAQSAEARFNSLHDEMENMKLRIQDFKKNFGIKEKQGGLIQIDYKKFAENLGMEQALELRSVIDDVYRISGAAGEKPKVRVSSRVPQSGGD